MTFAAPAIISITEEWAGCDRPPVFSFEGNVCINIERATSRR